MSIRIDRLVALENLECGLVVNMAHYFKGAPGDAVRSPRTASCCHAGWTCVLAYKGGTDRGLVDWLEIGAYSVAARMWAFAHALSSFRLRYAEVRRDVQVEVDRLTRQPVEERV